MVRWCAIKSSIGIEGLDDDALRPTRASMMERTEQRRGQEKETLSAHIGNDASWNLAGSRDETAIFLLSGGYFPGL